ncbi:hypothetical protein [Georgenia sp. AZ-5]|uniref:hypothetical protein n=1 Tax=Georgenia sp. AZ-5 TaxID=3367526 RepID=UPI003754B641
MSNEGPLNVQDLLVVEEHLSPERLGPYMDRCGHDITAALGLYRWNSTVSAAFSICLGHVEVLLRNAAHRELSRLVPSTERWYVTLASTLDTKAREDIAKAQERATRGGRPETPGKVVAELNFGFWRYLLTPKYHPTLWVPGLRRCMPHANAKLKEISTTVGRVYALRNRIAHHEPIHHQHLARLHDDARKIAGWIAPVPATWIERYCLVDRIIAQKPGSAADSPRTSTPAQVADLQ